MFARPAKLLLIAMDKDNVPMWGASVVPQRIDLDYSDRHTEIEVTGVLLDGPTPIEDIVKELGGLA